MDYDSYEPSKSMKRLSSSVPALRDPGVSSRGESLYAPAGPIKGVDAPINFTGIYSSVFRGRGSLILGLTLLGIVVGVAIARVQTPNYRASASLELDGVNDLYLSIRDVSPDATDSLTDAYMETQAAVLGSETTVRRALEKQPTKTLPDVPSGHRFEVASLLRKMGSKQFTPVASEDSGVAKVMQNLAVRTVTQTRVIRVTYEDTDPYAAADFTNALMNAYIDSSVERRWETTQNTERWLTEYVSRLKESLEKSSRQLESFANDSGLLGTRADDTPAEAKLRDLQSELSKAHGERISKQALYETVANGSREGISPNINGPLREYQTKLSDLRSQRAQLISTLTPAHFRVQQIDAQISEMEQLISKEWDKTLTLIRSDYEAAQRREQLLTDSVYTQTALVADQAGKRVHYDILRSELETNQQIYNSVLQKAKESAVLGATRPTNIHILDKARPPALPFQPSVPIYASVGGMSAFFGGLLWVAYSGRGGKNLIAPGTLPEVAQVRELGVIPSTRLDSKVNERHMLFGRRRPNPDFIFSESFNSTVASILSTESFGSQPTVITITSATAGEGKTTVVKNLGLALANIGRKVVLIDGDMRHPKLSSSFDIENSWGLSDILQSRNAIEDMPFEALAKRTEYPSLFVLPSGPSVANITSLLYSPNLNVLLETLKKYADVILIDSAPLLAVSDARILGLSSDSVIFVVRAHKTGRQIFQTAAQQLIDDHIQLLGIILNDWDSRRAPGVRDPFQYRYAYRD
jgi:succinoglycan biosynthesis transport protein ExoP